MSLPTEQCYICWHNSNVTVPAVAICNELQRPVCSDHAIWCVREEHGTRELETVE